MSYLLALTGQPCCYPVLFGPLMMNLVLSWLQLWNQEEAHSYHHGQTNGSEASLPYHLHQRQLMSCGTMDQPDNIDRCSINHYYPTLLRRVQISRETSTNITRYLYSSHSSRPREVQNLVKSEFWEKKSLDNKSLIRRFGV